MTEAEEEAGAVAVTVVDLPETWRGRRFDARRPIAIRLIEKWAVKLGDFTALRAFRRRGAYSTGR
jgi:hypothetical protein